jgi:NAD(P)-dependent dehydrogenase (short-subunit alcohol dehydrogenase family)
MKIEANSGRTIVITGAGSGIGRAAALACARRGDKVAVLDISSQAVAQTAAESLVAGAEGALGLVCDVCDEAQVEAAFARSSDAFGPPYGVFANAGFDIGGLIHEMPLENWDRILRTNLTGIFLTCKHGLRHMLGANVRGSVVCSASPAGFVAQAAGSCGAYSATKGGISSLVRCMAIDYAPFGIRVNAVVPGATETGMMWNNVEPAQRDAMRAQLYREIPLGRLGQPEDPARAVLWLLSDQSDYVTGSHLVCDGGILAKSSISV